MKIVVIGGTGLIGRAVVRQLGERGHEAVAASPTTGVNTVTKIGLAEALQGADVVVDLADVPTFDAGAALEYLQRSTGNLLRAEEHAGVGHHIGLSIVGADRLPNSGYMRAKLAQEALVRAAGVPFTMLHATQSFEAMRPVADGATYDGTVRVSPALLQPIAAGDISTTLADLAERRPHDGTYEVAGPERLRLVDIVAEVLASQRDPRPVVATAGSPYFGSVLDNATLVPADDAWIGPTRFGEWLQRTVATERVPSAGR